MNLALFFVSLQLQITLILSAVNVIACLSLGITKVIVGHKLESRALITDSKYCFIFSIELLRLCPINTVFTDFVFPLNP